MTNPIGIILWLLFIAFLWYVYEVNRDINNVNKNATNNIAKNDTKNDNNDIGEDTYV